MDVKIKFMDKNTVSIIVVTYNRIEYLKHFIEFLYLSVGYPFKLIVIDNGSIDGSRDLIIKLKKEGLIWKYLFNKENMLLASAFTEGFKLVDSEFVITVADDMTPPLFKKPDWLEIFVAQMNKDEKIGCINFSANRCSFSPFNKKSRPLIEARIKKEGGETLKKFNKLEKLIYDR